MQLIQDFSIKVGDSEKTPIFKQITEQVKQAIAANKIQKGTRLPSVRQLAKDLGVNPGTVARAYIELEQENVVTSRRGGGTIVTTKADNPTVTQIRQRRLSNLVGNHIIETLSLGYSPEELEAEFSLHLSRWREERKETVDSTTAEKQKPPIDARSLVIVGSHDLALDMLINKLKIEHPEIKVNINYAGSLGGLIALQEERANLAGIHLLDEETGEYNYPYLKHLLPGRVLAVVHLAYRIQGLMFLSNNPKKIHGFDDLVRSDVKFINRQKGSGTRVLLDFELRKRGIEPSKIKGYEYEVDTHLAVALSIAHGGADVGLGIQAAADASDLGFLPLTRERYDLIIPSENYRDESIRELLIIVTGVDFKKIVANIGGYDTSQTGSTVIFP
jgi:molybdate-binding protein/DNA-binding transcriptional regulator YhcF (GntR family)